MLILLWKEKKSILLKTSPALFFFLIEKYRPYVYWVSLSFEASTGEWIRAISIIALKIKMTYVNQEHVSTNHNNRSVNFDTSYLIWSTECIGSIFYV